MFLLVKDLREKKYKIIQKSTLGPSQEVLFEFEQTPFPDNKCNDCGCTDETVKEREWGYGLQCYKCFSSDMDFEDNYK
ncbi:MAG TPA: hypothetical protein VFV86_05395 [Nitrososphaeraceae archaeon]|nr:hypothetical protein [Nitrososphaeraceae archaeon]